MDKRKLLIVSAIGATTIPGNVVLYEDGTPVRYEDGTYVTYE